MQIEKAHAQPVREVFAALESSKEGLSSKESERRLGRYGPNVLVEEKRFKTLRLLLAQFKNLFILLLLLAVTLSFLFESVVNGVLLLFVVALNVGSSFFQERKAERMLEALRAIYPPKIEVVRGGKTAEIPVGELVIGDVVVLREGGTVPADLRLFEVHNLKIDESTLTGESVPSTKVYEALPESLPLADRENMAFAGTLVVSGTGKGVVTQTGLRTEFGQIAAFVQEQEGRSLLLERIAHLSIWLVGISATLSLLIFVLGFWRSQELIHTLNFSIALFVSAVPESLPTITTLALTTTALRLSRRKALVRHLPTVEALSGINLFAFDKTGTLTRNEMSVAKIIFPDRELVVTGTGFSSDGQVLRNGAGSDPRSDPQLREFIEVGALGASATITPVDESADGKWVVHGDPTEGAFLILAEKTGMSLDRGNAARRFAFTSERKMSSGVFFKDKELRVYSLGAPEVLLPKCRYYLHGRKQVELSPARRVELENQASRLAADGYRVLALAMKKQTTNSIASRELEQDLTFVGFGGLLDRPKEMVAETFTNLMRAGIKPVIITGDHPGTASAVAKELGLKLAPREILSGSEINRMTDEELLEVIPRITVFARITPTQKYRLVKMLKRFGLRVAVSGDGVNDASALKEADVGVVMGEKGSDVSKEAADLVILDDKIETVIPAIVEARTLYDNIKKFFTFLLSSNFDELLVIAWAFLMGLPQPLTILQVLWLNLITDGLPALALAFDPPSGDVLKESPRELGSSMVRPIVGCALFYGLLALICNVFIVLLYLSDVTKMRTVLFTQAVLFELAVVFAIRGESRPFWRGFFENKYLLAAVAVSALIQVSLVYVPALHPLMGITFLNVSDWGVVLGVTGGAFTVAEIGKWVWRSRYSH